MIRPLTVRLSVLAASIALAISAHASVNAVTDTVKGRPATVSNATISNQSAPGLNPAQGDVLEVTYDYSDPDAIPEDTNLSVYGWMADGSAAGEPLTGDTTFVPGASLLDKYLTVQITAAESAPSDPDRATMVESAPTAAPVLPPRAEFNSLYHVSGQDKSWGDAYMYCAERGERLLTIADFEEMFITYTRATAIGQDSENDIENTYGVNLGYIDWASDPDYNGSGDLEHAYFYTHDKGNMATGPNTNKAGVTCARFGGTEGLPSVTNVNVPDPVIGTALTATYTYNGNATIPDRSRFQWYRADDAAGAGKTAIAGATAVTYTPVAEDAGKWLIIEVTPASYDTVVGTKVSDTSNVAVAVVPDATQSFMTFTPDTIVQARDGVGDVSTLTVTLKDAGGNLLPGQTVSHVSWDHTMNGPVTAQNPLIDNGDGTYSAPYWSNFDGTFTATGVYIVNAGSYTFLDTEDATLTVTPREENFPSGTTLEANGHDFGIDSGFPTTGFTQARFQVQISGNASNNSGYTWSTDQSWASVDSNGTVTFTGSASGGSKSLKITAKKSNAIYSKTITLSQWFVTPGKNEMEWSDANNYCNNYSGNYSLGTTQQLSGTSAGDVGDNGGPEGSYDSGVRGTIGGLWSEWGEVNLYNGSGFTRDYFYTSEKTSWGGHSEHKMTSLYSGHNSRSTDMVAQSVVCRTTL